jgi:uncharacterized membrane protein YoaK (UPF0700 family)
MDSNTIVLGIIGVIGLVSLVGFFKTKTKGFGRFATSALLMLLVILITSLLFAAGKLEAPVLVNIFFAVIGFAGGLFTTIEQSAKEAAPTPADRGTG